MDSATVSNRTLEIDGMAGEECVQKVTGALKGIHGVSTASVKVGTATIRADQAGCDEACAAIGRAGYKSHDRGRENGSSGQASGASRDSSGNRGGDTHGAPNQGQGRGGEASGVQSQGQSKGGEAFGAPTQGQNKGATNPPNDSRETNGGQTSSGSGHSKSAGKAN